MDIGYLYFSPLLALTAPITVKIKSRIAMAINAGIPINRIANGIKIMV
jgi:hypothetical protein